MSSVPALVQQLKLEEQDFEWYPTTPEIIKCVKRDIRGAGAYNLREDGFSVLDCGAGDGRVLRELTNGDRYAIEKAELHLAAINQDVFIVGTEFREQSLIDKKVDVLFCNPPYSEFEWWAAKIIREANAALVYLVIPTRWNQCHEILDALKARECKAKVLSTFDFHNAERAARATVDVIRIKLFADSRGTVLSTDPFDVWFDAEFKLQATKRRAGDDEDEAESSLAGLNSKKDDLLLRAKQQLVSGGDYVQVLEGLFNHDMQVLFENYRHFEAMDANLLREVGVTAATVKASLQQRIAGLKDVYWKTFFDTFAKITSKLITSKRKHMLDKIMQHVHIDFTCSNAYAIAVWAIKNANSYFDEQLCVVFERMISQANVQNYTSNQTTFGDEQWRWSRKPEGLTKFKLDYRVVLEHAGGICSGDKWDRDRNNGLSETGVEYLRDLRTVADNLGFKVEDYPEQDPMRLPRWESNQRQVFHACYHGKEVVLMEVRGFYNRNFHIKFNQQFLTRLNVEFGRLKGWLRDWSEAAEELQVAPEEAAAAFQSNIRLTGSPQVLLGLLKPTTEPQT